MAYGKSIGRVIDNVADVAVLHMPGGGYDCRCILTECVNDTFKGVKPGQV